MCTHFYSFTVPWFWRSSCPASGLDRHHVEQKLQPKFVHSFEVWLVVKNKCPVFNPILDGGGGGKFAPPPAIFFNIAQKPLGLESWNFVTFSFYI